MELMCIEKKWNNKQCILQRMVRNVHVLRSQGEKEHQLHVALTPAVDICQVHRAPIKPIPNHPHASTQALATPFLPLTWYLTSYAHNSRGTGGSFEGVYMEPYMKIYAENYSWLGDFQQAEC